MPMYIGVWQEYQMGKAAEERAKKLDEWKKANAPSVDDILTNNRIAPIALQKKDPVQPKRRRARPAGGLSPHNIKDSHHISSSSESQPGRPPAAHNKDPASPPLRSAEPLTLPRLGMQYFSKNKTPMANVPLNPQVTSEAAPSQANAPPSKHRHIQHFTGMDVGGIPVEAVTPSVSADTTGEGRSNGGLRSLPPVREAVAPRYASALPPPQYSSLQTVDPAPRNATAAAGPSGAATPATTPLAAAPDTPSQHIRQQQDQQGQYLRAAALGVGGSVATLLAEAKAQAPGTRPKERRWVRLSGERGERQALYRDYLRARRGSQATQHSSGAESSEWPRWCADAAQPQQPPRDIAIPVHAPALRVLHPDLRSHLEPHGAQPPPTRANGSPSRVPAQAPLENDNPHFRSHYTPNASAGDAPQRTSFTVDRVLTGGALNGDYRTLYQRAAAPGAAPSLSMGVNATQSMAQMRVARLMQLYGMQLPQRDAVGTGGVGPAPTRDAPAPASAHDLGEGQGNGSQDTRTDCRERALAGTAQGAQSSVGDCAPPGPTHVAPSAEQRAWEQFQQRRAGAQSAARVPASAQAPVQLAPLAGAEGARASKRILHSSASAPAQPRGTLRRPAHAARGGVHRDAPPAHARMAVSASGTATVPAPADSGAARLDMASLRAQLLQLNPHLGAVLTREAPQQPTLPHSRQNTRTEAHEGNAVGPYLDADTGNTTGHAAVDAPAATSEWTSGEWGLSEAAHAAATEVEAETVGRGYVYPSSGDRGTAGTHSESWDASASLDDSFAAGLAAIDAVLEEEECW